MPNLPNRCLLMSLRRWERLFVDLPTKQRRKRLKWPPQADLRMFKHRSS
jgi:hypothetical protein